MWKGYLLSRLGAGPVARKLAQTEIVTVLHVVDCSHARTSAKRIYAAHILLVEALKSLT